MPRKQLQQKNCSIHFVKLNLEARCPAGACSISRRLSSLHVLVFVVVAFPTAAPSSQLHPGKIDRDTNRMGPFIEPRGTALGTGASHEKGEQFGLPLKSSLQFLEKS